MAAQHLPFALNKISRLLDTTTAGSSFDMYYIAIRALRIMLDPSSGFLKFAPATPSQDLTLIISNFIQDSITDNLGPIYQMLEEEAGVASMGTNPSPLNNFIISPFHGGLQRDSIGLFSAHHLLSSNDESLGQVSGTLLNLAPKSSGILNETSTHGQLIEPVAQIFEPSAIDEVIMKTMTNWFTAVGIRGKKVEKYFHDSTIFEEKNSRRKVPKTEHKSALAILFELFSLIKYCPFEYFVGSQFFIGTYITHVDQTLGRYSAHILLSIFETKPDLRLEYVIFVFLNI
jgi:hypothetical protein